MMLSMIVFAFQFGKMDTSVAWLLLIPLIFLALTQTLICRYLGGVKVLINALVLVLSATYICYYLIGVFLGMINAPISAIMLLFVSTVCYSFAMIIESRKGL